MKAVCAWVLNVAAVMEPASVALALTLALDAVGRAEVGALVGGLAGAVVPVPVPVDNVPAPLMTMPGWAK
jgi:hypothetical protein